LLEEFAGAGVQRRIFVEPVLKTDRGSVGPKPDVLICNRGKIIGVVELKYLPRVGPQVKKDLRTLDWVASHQKHISIGNERYLGIAQDERGYSLAADAVLCWAGVHRGPAGLRLQSRVSSRVKPRFMELHAVTGANVNPEIVSNYKPRGR